MEKVERAFGQFSESRLVPRGERHVTGQNCAVTWRRTRARVRHEATCDGGNPDRWAELRPLDLGRCHGGRHTPWQACPIRLGGTGEHIGEDRCPATHS